MERGAPRDIRMRESGRHGETPVGGVWWVRVEVLRVSPETGHEASTRAARVNLWILAKPILGGTGVLAGLGGTDVLVGATSPESWLQSQSSGHVAPARTPVPPKPRLTGEDAGATHERLRRQKP